jgi:lipoprotein-releasing system permease protein
LSIAVPITIFLGIRLSALTSENRFVAMTSRLAVLGIMLGVATLITVLSVMRGFEYEIRHSLIKNFDHLQVFSFNHQYPDALYEEIRQLDNVVAVTGYAESYGLIRLNQQYLPMLLLSFQDSGASEGAIYLSNSDSVFLSNEDKVNIVMPSSHKMMPKQSQLLFKGPIDDKNTRQSLIMAEVAFQTYQKVTGLENLSGLTVVVDDLYATSRIKQYLKERYHGLYQGFDWKDKYQPLFSALRLQRTVMIFVLSMITIVAMFSLISGLVMLSSDRRLEIALLRVMGMSKAQLKALFIVQGAFIGFIGVLLGVLLGLTLCHFASDIAICLESILGYELIDERIYGVSTLPTLTDPKMVGLVSIMGFIASVIAAIYPASRIAKQDAIEVLRYG